MSDPEPATPADPVRNEVNIDWTPPSDVDEAMLTRRWVEVQREIARRAPTTEYASRIIEAVEPIAIPALALALDRDPSMIADLVDRIQQTARGIEDLIRDLI